MRHWFKRRPPDGFMQGLLIMAGLNTGFLAMFYIFIRQPYDWVDWTLIFWPWGLVFLKWVIEVVEYR